MNFTEFIKKNDYLYFALRSKKVLIGTVALLFFLLLGLAGPFFMKHGPNDMMVGAPQMPPSPQFLLGTTYLGEDVLSQLVYGLRSTLFVGFLGACIGTAIGFTVGFVAGYNGGKLIDEILMLLTNIMLVLPVLAVLIILGCYLPYRGITIEAIIIGCTIWPWVARAVRAQTLSIKNKEFVNLSRISAHPTSKTIIQDIATNMFSYCFMAFIHLFNGVILTSVGFDVIGLGPIKGISIGLILYWANKQSAVTFGAWWWPFFPGIVLTLLITTLYLINTGLDEAFNPRLREM
jgi:peptide/nickel transport system permease protein